MSFDYFFFDLGNTLTVSYDLVKSIRETKYGDIEKDKMSIFAVLFESRLKNENEKKIQPANYKELINNLLVKSNIRINENEVDEFIECFLTAYIKKCKIASYSDKVLSLLFEKEKCIALVSNVTGPRHVFDTHLTILGIDKYFQAVVWSTVLGYRKPAREIFEYAIEITNANIDKSVFIGDNEKADIIGANSVGLKTVLLVDKISKQINTKADWVIRKKDFFNFISELI